jgi:hypothetical protein
MTLQTLVFGYPRRGLSGEFATFRLGSRAAEKYAPGTDVELIDSKSKRVLLCATVTEVHVGTLTEMASLHAHQAHNWKEHPTAERPGLLVDSMKKRYRHFGPDRCSDTSVCSVIFLREIP